MKDPQAQERELVRRCLAADRDAWEEFIRRYTPLLAASIVHTLRRLGQPQDPSRIRDLIQDVFVSLLKNDSASLRTCRLDRPLGPYLSVIASRRCIDWFQAERRVPADRLEELQGYERWIRDGIEADAACPPPGSNAEDLRQRVRDAARRLSARERLALQLFYWDGLDAPAIGRVLRLRAEAVWTLLSRARASLRGFLSENSFCL